MNFIFSSILKLYSIVSASVVLLLLLQVMAQIFPKKTFVKNLHYYGLSGVSFLLLYQGPRIFRQGERMPYYYLFVCFIFISILWSGVFLQGNFLIKLPYLFYFYAFYKCIIFTLSWFYSLESSFSDQNLYQFLCTIASVLELAALYIFTRIYIRHPFRFTHHFNASQTALLLFCPISFFALLQLADPSIRVPYLAFLSIAAACLLVNIPIFYYLYVTVEEQYESHYALEKALRETSAQLTRYRYTILIEEQAHRERHELKNRYFYIQTLLREHELEKLKNYIDSTIGELSDIDGSIHSNNLLIDHILNTKLALAHKKGIKTYTEILLPTGFKINEEYFCTILLNLLDNAIENSQSEPEPDLHILMNIKNRYLVCTIKNKVSEAVLQNNPDLHTTKKDSKNHGLGLKIIRTTAKKANALFDVTVESNYFTATIMMPLENS